jgi:Golgi nucleoside diphosphatase
MPGSGAVVKPINGTFGTIDLGGASAQIAFFVPSQDISEGLFKLQIGSQRHWNVYAKSFLGYGHNSAKDRHVVQVATAALDADDEASDVSTHCFFSGYEESVDVQVSGKSHTHTKTVKVRGPHSPHSAQFSDCSSILKTLMQKELNVFCNVVYHSECSMDGFYQPRLPGGKGDGQFIAAATYKYAFSILNMPQRASLSLFKQKAATLCSLDYSGMKKYHKTLNTTLKKDELLPYYCFITTYVAVLLECAKLYLSYINLYF